jgi:YidC/Oxa1 family membrane protein insertase
MDKRLSLALLLTALIVAITPILFPTPKRATSSTKAATVANRDTVVDANRTAPAVVGAVRDSASITPPVTAASARITTVSTNLSTYEFSDVGAAPISVTMKNYKNLSSTARKPVTISVPGRTLIRYSLVVQRDTIPLYNVPFQLSSSEQVSGDKTLTYRASIAGQNVAIAYSLLSDKHLARVSGRVDGASKAYLLIDMPPTLPVTEADTLSDLRTRSYSLKPQRDNAHGIPFAKLDPGEKRLEPGPITWVAVRNKYFVVGLLNPAGSTFAEMTLTGGPRTTKLATNTSGTVVKALTDGTFAFDMYVGPQQSTELMSLGRDFDHVNPYGWTFLQPIVNPIAALCIKLILWMHAHLKLSYGWVLIIFGVAIRVALWPLNQSAMRSSLKMQELQPKLADVQKKYKDDPVKQREAMMRVYQEAGASPFTALSGCLPMLIPMPVLFALFFVFQNTIEFRGVPFLWLTDISTKDPFYILPVLMGISMYLLSWIGLRNAPPNPQAKMMSYMFPVMMTFVLANMASGLNLYYTAQNLAALPQQWFLAKERQKVRRPG